MPRASGHLFGILMSFGLNVLKPSYRNYNVCNDIMKSIETDDVDLDWNEPFKLKEILWVICIESTVMQEYLMMDPGTLKEPPAMKSVSFRTKNTCNRVGIYHLYEMISCKSRVACNKGNFLGSGC